ncbi:MAG: hypothetical protein HOH50_14700 [Planctomycetaceae bacterium]|nr:hypothetical protein [Planctomycetaceae bacterium]
MKTYTSMHGEFLNSGLAIVFVAVSLCVGPTAAQVGAQISPNEIAALETKLGQSVKAASSARKKLELNRVLREGDALLAAHKTTPNRYEVLGILFRAQQALLGLENSTTNRARLLAICRQLAAAPNEYAAIRLDADLLLSQVEQAKKGADLQARANALRPLISRYQGTQVETKVIRIAMLMALEFGDVRLVGHLQQVIAERCPGDPEMINFQRDKLGGQVFGAPFIGRFEQADGKVVRFPMDTLGTTTALYFWSKDDDGMADLEELAVAWKKVPPADSVRMRFVSMNLDGLPDAGESILRGLGLDWPALKLPGGRDHLIYKTYARRDPSIITVSPTGYAALFMSGGRRSRGYERNLQSMLARVWTKPHYTGQLQSMFTGECLIVNPTGDFDPAAPPEWRAVGSSKSGPVASLTRTNASVPAEVLASIQACFIQTPMRYRAPLDQVRRGFEKADALCRQAIAEHADADDLWIVRNRRIIALLGLWQLTLDQAHLEAAVVTAETALAGSYPQGTDVVARFCLAKYALRATKADPASVINRMIEQAGEDRASGNVLAAAAVLALDVGDRLLHEQYRRAFLDKHSGDPVLWTATSFLLDRYQRYWLYHPPFVAGWTYGRRQGHFLATGQPEDATRSLNAEFKTLDGKTLRIPESSAGKWTVISFIQDVQSSGVMRGKSVYIKTRPFDDVNLFVAVLTDDVDATKAVVEARKNPEDYPIVLVPGGMQNSIVQELGFLEEDTRPNIVILRPDGSVAAALSGMTMSSQHGDVVQNVIEWHDEQAVDAALARNDLDEAKRLAFAFAPVVDSVTPDKKPAKAISVPHLRSRAKVYLAMQQWQAAFDDAEQAYLAVNIKAGWLSMRTAELDMTEKLKATIIAAREQAESSE